MHWQIFVRKEPASRRRGVHPPNTVLRIDKRRALQWNLNSSRELCVRRVRVANNRTLFSKLSDTPRRLTGNLRYFRQVSSWSDREKGLDSPLREASHQYPLPKRPPSGRIWRKSSSREGRSLRASLFLVSKSKKGRLYV